MPNIYEQHDAAFARVSAYVILKDGERVATIAFKSPRDGAGRLYAYVHWIGLEMVRGHAGGYGYDKHSAAIAHAMRLLAAGAGKKDFVLALRNDDGRYWNNRLEAAGFRVLQAV